MKLRPGPAGRTPEVAGHRPWSKIRHKRDELLPGEREEDDARELVEAGTELAGALSGGAVGTIGGPLGIVAGAATGVLVQRAARAVVRRLSHRERERVGAALIFIDEDSARREERGERVRNDGFFDDRGRVRPEAEDLLEAVLRQAAVTCQERKLPFLARLYSAVKYGAAVGGDDALYLLGLAGALTFREFQALAVYAHRVEHEQELLEAWFERKAGQVDPIPSVLLELDDLYERRLLGVSSGGQIVEGGLTWDSIGPGSSHEFSTLRLARAGEQLVRLAGLDEIGEDDRRAWLALLEGPVLPPHYS